MMALIGFLAVLLVGLLLLVKGVYLFGFAYIASKFDNTWAGFPLFIVGMASIVVAVGGLLLYYACSVAPVTITFIGG